MSRPRTLLFVLTWIFFCLITALGVVDAVLAPAPAPRHPDFIDTILASRAVVAAIRLAIVFAAAFVVLSVIALTAQRRWLVRVGPVEVSDRVFDLDAENQRLEEELANAYRIIEELERSAAGTQRLINRKKGI